MIGFIRKIRYTKINIILGYEHHNEVLRTKKKRDVSISKDWIRASPN